MNTTLHVVEVALIGGFLPALLWLWFWLREDSEHPEPRRLIALAFLAGMASVTIAVPLEQFVQSYITGQTMLYTVWAYIEEIVKFGAALLTVLWRDEDDEPIDALIYMVVVALGFAAAENALFLSSPLGGTSLAALIITGNLRFMGATLLHVLASSVIGAAIGLVYYGNRIEKALIVTIGVILAGLLHALFNVRILNSQGASVMETFILLWVCIILMFALIEWIKRIKPQNNVIINETQ
jgi:RsiW-degrading membrane proteinase PrsW (M82 family)